MAALSVAGLSPAASELLGSSVDQVKEGVSGSASKEYIQDAGIKMCFAYFAGMEAEQRKVQFGRQLNVLGAVGGIDRLVDPPTHETRDGPGKHSRSGVQGRHRRARCDLTQRRTRSRSRIFDDPAQVPLDHRRRSRPL